MQTITAKEYLMLGKNSKKNKYNNKKVSLDGHTFDSKLEADYYAELKLRKKAKKILYFKLQSKFLLQLGFKKDNKKIQPIYYIADFGIHHNDGTIEVVDTKGVKTDVFRIKEKSSINVIHTSCQL